MIDNKLLASLGQIYSLHLDASVLLVKILIWASVIGTGPVFWQYCLIFWHFDVRVSLALLLGAFWCWRTDVGSDCTFGSWQCLTPKWQEKISMQISIISKSFCRFLSEFLVIFFSSAKISLPVSPTCLHSSVVSGYFSLCFIVCCEMIWT